MGIITDAVPPDLRLRQAGQDDIGAVAHVLSGAAQALDRRGVALWSQTEVSESAVAGHVLQGMYHLAFDEKAVIGVFRFQLADPLFWPEVPQGSSAFIHKLAVHPQRQGQGVAQRMLTHACALTRQHGRAWLRLDCASGRPRLQAMYEGFGFRHHSDTQLGRVVFHRFEFDVRHFIPA